MKYLFLFLFLFISSVGYSQNLTRFETIDYISTLLQSKSSYGEHEFKCDEYGNVVYSHYWERDALRITRFNLHDVVINIEQCNAKEICKEKTKVYLKCITGKCVSEHNKTENIWIKFYGQSFYLLTDRDNSKLNKALNHLKSIVKIDPFDN